MDAITIKLKKMLLSRNVVLQDKSIKFMINSLKDPKQFNVISTTYLNADMIHFLCEPLISIDTSLIKSICLCVWMLSKNNIFYERNDVLYTCNSLLRTLIFLIKNSDSCIIDITELLAIIIINGRTNLLEMCNVPQVLTVITMIFSNSHNLPGQCVINATSILTCILSSPSIELSDTLINTSLSISKSICKSVGGKLTVDPHVVDIASSLSSSLLRLYSTIKSRMSIDENLIKYKKIASLLKNIAWNMIKCISLPFFLNNMNLSMHFESYKKGIKSLLSPFKESLSTHNRRHIVNHYATSKIIRVLYELIECNKTINTLVEELLFQTLFYLSSAYLEIDCHWPGGTDMFHNQMAWSFKNFPKTHKDICLILMNRKSNNDLKYFIIIFIYFYLLTCSNVESESIYLEPLSVYLCSTQNKIPLPVIKALLFSISISFVSHHAVNAVCGLAFATQQLVALINSDTIDLVYTHHPALLYFLFASSIIPHKVQLQLIKLWIINLDEISYVELETFCLINYKAKLCLLAELMNDNNIAKHKIQMGFDIVKKIIAAENDINEHKTLLIIWDMLPTQLGSFCCNETPKAIHATNLIFVLNLTQSFSLSGLNVSINEHQHIVYTMSSIIKSYQSTFTEKYSLLSSLLMHLLTLLQLSNNDDVLNTVKTHNGFLSVLENLSLSENNTVCFLVFNTIIKLCQLEKEETKREHKLLSLIAVKCEYIILSAMSRLCHNCMLSSITLFQFVLKYYEEDTTVEFNETLNVEFLKSVFMQLETIICQGLDWVSDQAWECMTTILSSTFLKCPQKISDIKIELVTDPWLSFIITNQNSFSGKCLNFLELWFSEIILNKEDNFIIYGTKGSCQSLFDKTITHISITIVSQMYDKNELSSAKMIITIILNNGFLIPDKVVCKMNNFLNQN